MYAIKLLLVLITIASSHPISGRGFSLNKVEHFLFGLEPSTTYTITETDSLGTSYRALWNGETDSSGTAYLIVSPRFNPSYVLVSK